MKGKILVDRHHAGLLYSLQLLFEDRFDMDLYVPVGHDWWDEGYWRFGEVFQDDRLAQQYLNANPPWEFDPLHLESDGEWYTTDVEFPDRLIRGCSLDRFKAMQFDYVLASVQENQPGFARLAEEAGAKYLVQVGNRGQYVDWSLNPLCLVSAEAPFEEGRGVAYHQEYDKDTTFAARPLNSPTIIRSFVNCLDRMPVEWQIFQNFERAMPDFMFKVHGHDGRDGLIQPTTAIANHMGNAGWAWQDKPQGDGFGHVIHYWASIGRPLIGHARYYSGLMPGHLWDDGVTSIDTEAREPRETIELIREITADTARHQWMCDNIRERVDQLVDFEAEAAAIASLLGR